MPRGSRKKVKEHLNKARESALLAIEVYNRPTARFRTYGYIVLMEIAWTALLHAYFIKLGRKPYYRKKGKRTYEKIDGEPKRWELSECIKQYFPDQQSPIVQNLMFFIKLRNKIEHRDLPELDPVVYAESQSLLFNFEEIMEKEFETKWGLSDTLVIPLQLSRLRNNAQNDALRKAMKPLPEDINRFINAFRSALSDDISTDPAYSYKVFLVPNVKNNPSKEALAVEFVPYDPGEHEQHMRLIALIKERQVPVSNRDLIRPLDVALKVKSNLGDKKFNTNLHVRCWQFYKVRPNNGSSNPEQCNSKYCVYDERHHDYSYTKDWIEFLVRELSVDDKYYEVTGVKRP